MTEDVYKQGIAMIEMYKSGFLDGYMYAKKLGKSEKAKKKTWEAIGEDCIKIFNKTIGKGCISEMKRKQNTPHFSFL